MSKKYWQLTLNIFILSSLFCVVPSVSHAASNFSTGLNNAIGWAINPAGGGTSALPLYAIPPAPSIIGNVINFLATLATWITLLGIVIGGIMYVLATGDETKIARAKRILLLSVLGLLIVLIRAVIVNEVYGVLGLAPFVAGTSTLAQIIWNIIVFLRGIIAWIAVLFLVWGGIMYITSTGDEQKTNRAKQAILVAVIGLFIAAVSINIAHAVFVAIGWAAGSPWAGAGYATLGTLLFRIIGYILGFTSMLAVAAFIYGAITYITSGGSDEKLQRGKKVLIYATVGVVIIMISAMVVNIVLGIWLVYI